MKAGQQTVRHGSALRDRYCYSCYAQIGMRTATILRYRLNSMFFSGLQSAQNVLTQSTTTLHDAVLSRGYTVNFTCLIRSSARSAASALLPLLSFSCDDCCCCCCCMLLALLLSSCVLSFARCLSNAFVGDSVH
jgi:hypothetical protein